MLPSILSEEITKGLKSFITTGFETDTPFFAGMFHRFVEQPGNLMKGPYLSVALPFQQGSTSHQEFFSGFRTEFPPYHHQEEAWRRLRSSNVSNSTLIATGTGSGKTECFLYPLLDHCLQQHSAGQTRGIKAIVIYPMNALATDQAKRFAELIHQSSNMRGKLRVGLFVGEGEENPSRLMGPGMVITDKNALRNNPPDILLTNYKMLDFLLLRPKDQKLWRYNQPDTLRYLVVDELHTFDGAQGTDLACLIRRLKARLNTPEEQLICVGTSATLGSGDEQEALRHYAEQIFQSDFDNQSIISESRQPIDAFLAGAPIKYVLMPTHNMAQALDPDQYDTMHGYLEAQYTLLFPEEGEAKLDDMAWRIELGQQLKQHQLFYNLLRSLTHTPKSLDELASELNRSLHASMHHSVLLLINSLCALISIARDQHEQPLVNLRMQLWVRELRRMVTSLKQGVNDEGKALQMTLSFADDQKQAEGNLYLPLVQCTHCHATAWLARKVVGEHGIQTDLRSIYQTFFANDPESIMLLPLMSDEDEPDWKGAERYLCTHCAHTQKKTNGESCLVCGESELYRTFEPMMTRDSSRGRVSDHHCPVCASQNSMMVFGSRAASLSSVAIHRGFASTYNDDKKLIAFSDGVQDAAHRAGFFESRTWQHNMRMAMAQAIPEQGMALSDYYHHLPKFWRDTNFNSKALDEIPYICEFIAPNMLWYRDYVSLTEQGTLPEHNRLAEDIAKRMEWEVLAEFGYRARIGRSLEQTMTAAMGFRMEPIETAALELLMPLQEEFGLQHIGKGELIHFLVGLLIYLKQRGAICHRFLDAYITSAGKNFLLTRQSYLPSFTDYTASPVFLCGGNRNKKFDTLSRRNGKTWYQSWFYKVLGRNALLPEKIEQAVYPVVLDTLVRLGVLNAMESKGDVVWGLNPEHLYLSREPIMLETESQRDRLIVPKDMVESLHGMPSIAMHDGGSYSEGGKSSHWLTKLYLQGDIHRVIAREHTGLLSREDREQVENEFMSKNRQPWYPNLLSATPTLEMGIDIGDLSSVLLCSVPPAQANYLQRIGRAGRKDGNAFNMTVAAGAPHDLYFYADPAQMMAGRVEPPGVFLNASTVIKRQLVAYCMDCWVASGIDERAVPARLKPVLDHVENGALKDFPYNFIGYVSRHAPELLDRFLKLFEKELSDTSVHYLSHFLFGDVQTEEGEKGAGKESGIDSFDMYLIKRLFELVNERSEMKGRIKELGRYLKKLEKMPQDESTLNEIRDVGIERGGLQAILRDINSKQTMNFLTDEGLLPNYAFPEAGVTLRSVIFRKKDQVDESGRAYENIVFEYERAGAMAIGELAPENTFYAGGRKVAIQQVDMNLSEIEVWRFCPACSHSEKTRGDDTPGNCPRCGNMMWADAGQQVKMLRLRQVMANTSDRESRIGDDSDNREPTFYTRQMLADFESHSVEAAWKIKSDRLPFGFEFIRKATFREMNFGERGGNTQLIHIAGEEASRPGFKLCRHCGMVQDRRKNNAEQKHAYACKVTDKTDEVNLIDCLYLYREFTSEALRILLPVSTVEGGDQNLNSFIAALQLGLKRKFGGKIDHLRVMDYAEPISELASDGTQTASDYQRRYLMLYDSVPGGTGYLHELMQSPVQLLEVFRQARDVMVTCACNHDQEKDGCYSCLYAFRNSHGMETTSRTTAVDLFSKILDLSDQFEPVKSIDEITVNPVLDSELEARFVEAIKRIAMGEGHSLLGDVRIQQQVVNGKPGYFLTVGKRIYTIEPQVNVNMDDGVGYASKPDFMICSARTRDVFKPVAVFMDGYKYHKNKVTDDSAKRMALVQSGHFWQWSLTWDDVHREFSKSHTDSRNPFSEGLQASMKPLRDAMVAKLDVQAFEAYGGSSPLMQLLLFLKQPDSDKWRDYTFTRVLSWFDQTEMMTLHESCKGYFNSHAPTRLNQWLDDAGQCAFGGIGLADESDPLQLTCAAPLGAIKSVDAEKMMSSIFLNTDMASDVSFKRAWQGFLKAYNLMQFLPRTAFGTHDGVFTGVYEPIEWAFAEGVHETQADDEYSPEAAIVLEEVLDEYRDGVKQLFEAGLPLPVVAYEMQDEYGEIIAEAELAWINHKCVAVLAEQKGDFASIFIAKGWAVVELDENGQWLNSVREHLQGGE